MNACVIIPTYNEEKTIGSLINSIRSHNLEVVIVDDGSQDNTYKIASDSGVVVLRNETNQGKGASLIKGMDYALAKNFDAVITMDGDGQHLPEEIPLFLRMATHPDSDILIGNRMHKTHNMPLVRVWTNTLMSWFISAVAKQNIPDSQCGYRLIKKQVLKQIILTCPKFEIESEMLIKASRLGFKIQSIPIKAVYSGEKSRIHPVVDTVRFLKFVIRELWTTNH